MSVGAGADAELEGAAEPDAGADEFDEDKVDADELAFAEAVCGRPRTDEELGLLELDEEAVAEAVFAGEEDEEVGPEPAGPPAATTGIKPSSPTTSSPLR